MKATDRLFDMPPTRALAYCVNATRTIWRVLPSADVVALWAVFRAYIVGEYQDIGVEVPEQIMGPWMRCKEIIDREVGR